MGHGPPIFQLDGEKANKFFHKNAIGNQNDDLARDKKRHEQRWQQLVSFISFKQIKWQAKLFGLISSASDVT